MRWSKGFGMPPWKNPWPHDMMIRVNDHPQHLHQLLFVRHAWSIAADADIPELWPVPDTGSSRLPDPPGAAVWEDRWRTAWKRAWDWFNIEDHSHPELVTPAFIREATKPGQGLNPLIPPFWAAEYGMEGVDFPAFSRWDSSLLPDFPSPAERRNLPDLIPAWESGMDTVIVLPYAGYYAQRISRRHLVVSAVTRNEPESYRRALRTRM